MHVHELLVRELREVPADPAAELVGPHAGRVDHEVGDGLYALELPALAGNGVRHALPLAHERVAAAVLVVATHELLVGAVQEEDLVGIVVVGQGREGVAHLVEEALGADVAGNGQVAAHVLVYPHHLGYLDDQARREVVYAVVAHVLEDVHGLGAAAAAHAGDDHDVRHAVALGGISHLQVCVWHGNTPGFLAGLGLALLGQAYAILVVGVRREAQA